jgi:hypothetical protein
LAKRRRITAAATMMKPPGTANSGHVVLVTRGHS